MGWGVVGRQGLRCLVQALTKHLSANRVRDQLLAGAMDSNDQPQLLCLRPSDLSTAWALSLPSRPTSLTVATDGSRAYVGLVNGQIVQVDLATQAIASRFEISEGKGATYFPLSLAIRPGSRRHSSDCHRFRTFTPRSSLGFRGAQSNVLPGQPGATCGDLSSSSLRRQGEGIWGGQPHRRVPPASLVTEGRLNNGGVCDR